MTRSKVALLLLLLIALAVPPIVPTAWAQTTASSLRGVVRDEAGLMIGNASVPLVARGKTAVVLRDLPGLSAMAGTRGSADFTVAFGNVAVLGLRFGGAAFTSIPVAER